LAQARILLADLPRMRWDIIADLLAMERDMEVVPMERDMEVVGEVAALEELVEAVVRGGADVLVIGRDDSALAAELLERRPRLKVLAVAEEGRACSIYELRPQRVELGELSPRRLVAAIRAAMWPLSKAKPAERESDGS
jgi:DNA-binding NarL/FixJ family response regulator